MTQPTQGDVHVNRPLTNISIAYMQSANGFVADQVFPNIPVAMQSDLYYTYDRGFFNRDEMKKRAPGTESAGIGFEVATEPYFADVWGLHHDIPDQRRRNTDSPLQPDTEATNLLTNQALIRRERLWVDNYFKTGVWGVDVTGNASASSNQRVFWNRDSSTPIEDIRAAKTFVQQSTGFVPNTLVLGQEVYDKLVDHPDIVDRIKYGQTPGSPAIVNVQSMAALFDLERILVASAIYNSAAEGADNVHQFIGGKNAMLCYSAPNPGIMTPSAGYTFSWTGYLAAGNQGNRITRFRMDHLRSDRVEIEMAFDQKVIGSDLGYFFSDIIE